MNDDDNRLDEEFSMIFQMKSSLSGQIITDLQPVAFRNKKRFFHFFPDVDRTNQFGLDYHLIILIVRLVVHCSLQAHKPHIIVGMVNRSISLASLRPFPSCIGSACK